MNITSLNDIDTLLKTMTLTPTSYYKLLHCVSKWYWDTPGSTICKSLHIHQAQYSQALKITRALLPNHITQHTIDIKTIDNQLINLKFI